MSAEPMHQHDQTMAEPHVHRVPDTTSGARFAGGVRFAGSVIGRLILTLAGAAGLIVGAFMVWTQGRLGTQIGIRALFQTSVTSPTSFEASLGFAAIVVGLVAIVGLALSTGWMTRVAGTAGIVGFLVFVIQRYRASASFPGSIGTGAWLALAGAIVAIIGGFMRGRYLLRTDRKARG